MANSAELTQRRAVVVRKVLIICEYARTYRSLQPNPALDTIKTLCRSRHNEPRVWSPALGVNHRERPLTIEELYSRFLDHFQPDRFAEFGKRLQYVAKNGHTMPAELAPAIEELRNITSHLGQQFGSATSFRGERSQ
jgi:hypothetical protein